MIVSTDWGRSTTQLDPTEIVQFLIDHSALAWLWLRGYRSRHLATSVGKVHVLDATGTGPLPPVVLLHGFSSSGVHYGPLLRELRPRVRRVILPDLPAHGFSDTPAPGPDAAALRRGLIEALDAVLTEPAMLFGNSMGGFGAVQYALARPERVLGLVLCSPGGAAMAPDELRSFVGTFRIERHADAVAFTDRLFTSPSRMRQLYAWGIRRSFNAPAMRALLASLTPDDLLRPADLRALRMPILLLWGRQDRVFPRSHLAFFREHLPDHAEVEEPERFGHSPFLEDPGALAVHIERFLAGLERSAVDRDPRLAGEPLRSGGAPS
jgi:pimeloyl-ACP methyl ester carboxylesterase